MDYIVMKPQTVVAARFFINHVYDIEGGKYQAP